jgi:hypothetical protein
MIRFVRGFSTSRVTAGFASQRKLSVHRTENVLLTLLGAVPRNRTQAIARLVLLRVPQ